jgi:hypothetical protein
VRGSIRAARVRRWLTIGAAAAAVLCARRASAFGLEGHFIIEAAAYKRLLEMERVPGTGVSGRALLAALVADGVLVAPPCFDRRNRFCGARDRLEEPLTFWPRLGAGAADIIIDRQLSERGQCQHFMAETADGLSPVDPRLGVPGALATTAYSRCLMVLGAAFDGLLRDPRLAQRRLVGTYALMHAIQDSFSGAHAARDGQGRIVHLLSWKLIDWPSYWAHGRAAFPAQTHHGITDDRDEDYLFPDATTEEGRRCASVRNPYALSERCLTPRALAAVDAISDFLVLAYKLRARAFAAGREASLASPEDLALWREYVHKHLDSAAAPAEAPPPQLRIGIPRADTFIGAQSTFARDGVGVGAWGARMFYGPAVPFALSLAAGAGYTRRSDQGGVIAGVGAGLYLPLVRRFSIGATPAGVSVDCPTGLDGCDVEAFATLGELLVPLPHSIWLGVQGPRWSWSERALRGSVVSVALGWSHEQAPSRPAAGAEAAATWDPPTPDEVTGYRSASTSWLFFFAATAASTAENQWVGGGFEARRDRDRWNRRSGWAPALSVAAARGTIEGTHDPSLTVAPLARYYLATDRLWLGVTPAAVRIGPFDGQAFGADVAGTAAVGLIIGKLEISVESPPLSYVSRDRWHALPLPVRLGLLFD